MLLDISACPLVPSICLILSRYVRDDKKLNSKIEDAEIIKGQRARIWNFFVLIMF
jgi:hypothetical protein